MAKIRVTAVSYLNTVPLLYGIRNSAVYEAIDLRIAPPAQCALAFERGDTDIALVPVASLLKQPHYELLSDYCIGASGKVRTVVVMANDPLDQLQTIYLDPDSRTSVILVQILARRYWNIRPAFKPFTPGQTIGPGEGCVLIGDKVFAQEARFSRHYDLAEHWHNFTGLPFVFAAWASHTSLPQAFIDAFNQAMHFGVQHINESLTEPPPCSHETAVEYLSCNISYPLDTAKRRGLELFRQFIKEDML